MAEYYRSIFVIDDTSRQGVALLDDVNECVRGWVADVFGVPYSASEERGEWENDRGRLSLYNRRMDALSISRLIWERDDGGGPDARSRLILRLATDGVSVEADLEVKSAHGDANGRRIRGSAKMPSFLGILFDRFRCSIDGVPLETRAKSIATNDAEWFVRDEIFGARRTIPLIIVSADRNGISSVDADELQSYVLGLARVYVYGHDAAWHIAKDLPQSLRCYDGAIRLYYPGCSEDDIPQRNPYWLPEDIQNLGVSRWAQLRGECMNHMYPGSWRNLFMQVQDRIRGEEVHKLEIANSSLTAKLQQQLEEQQEDGGSGVVSESVQQSDLDNIHDELDALMEVFLSDNEESALNDRTDDNIGQIRTLKKISSALYRHQRNKAEKLSKEKQGLQEKIEQLTAGRGSPADEHTDKVNAAHKPRFSSVREMVEYADANLAGLRFLRNAFETAKSNYTGFFDNRADGIYRVFTVLDECANQRAQEGSLNGKDVHGWLRDRRVHFSDESESTKKQHSAVRTFYDDVGRRDRLMTEHLKVFRNEMRIHVFWEEDESKWLVGHIGKHLPTSLDPR